LRFAEDQFGLGQLAASDTRANDPQVDCFDFSKPPHKFVRIKVNKDFHYFMTQPPDLRPPDYQ
jgi:hypothetical protein